MEKKPDRSEIITMTLLFALTLVLFWFSFDIKREH